MITNKIHNIIVLRQDDYAFIPGAAKYLLVFGISQPDISERVGIMPKLFPYPARDARRKMGVQPNHAAMTG